MKYLKVFTDLYKALEPFGYAEKGRLFDAILRYAESGEQPELTGNERYIWPTIKADIDRQREAYQHQCEVNKVNATNRYEPLRIVTNGNEPKQEKTKEKTKDKEKNKRNIFVPPTVKEVEDYCNERQNGIDAQSFVDYYEANGWKQGAGRKPIVDWRACVRTWERNSNQTRAKPNNFDARSFLMGKEDYIDI